MIDYKAFNDLKKYVLKYIIYIIINMLNYVMIDYYIKKINKSNKNI